MSEVFLAKAKGEDEKAKSLFESAEKTFDRHKAFLEKYFLYSLYYPSLTYCAKIVPEDSTYVL